MLDLVGDRSAVGVPHPGKNLEQRFPLDPDSQDRGRDSRHQLRSQVEVLRLDRGIAARLLAERVQAGREMAVGSVGLEQRGGRLHRL